jgi:hypothetical protein
MADNANSLKMWQEAASAGKDCLSLETLERLAENASADVKAAAHLSGCAHCQTELQMLKSFEAATPSAQEGAAVAWIAAQLQRRQTPAKPAPVMRVPFWQNLFRVPYMAGAAALALVLVVGVSLYHSESGKPPVGGPRTGIVYRNTALKLLAPSGDLSHAPDVFRWEAVPGAASYKVELTDALNKPLASATSTQPQLDAPPEMKASMHHGVPVQWKVTAFNAARKSIAESSGGSFKVK